MRKLKLSIGVLLSCAALATSAAAQSQIGFRGAGGHLGLADPSNWTSAFAVGAVADLGTLAPNLLLDVNADYWSKSEQAAFLGESFETSVRDFTIGGTVRYLFGEQNNAKVQPYGCGGLGLHFVKAELKVSDEGAASASETKIGLDLGGGALFRTAGSATFFGELRYRVVSDIDQVCLRAGVLVALGN